MDELHENTILITRYLDGELTGNELESIKQLLASDPVARRELEELQTAKRAVQHFGLKQRVAAIHAQKMKGDQLPVTKRSPVTRMFSPLLRVAAVLLVIASLIAVYQYTTLSSTTLYQQAYQPYTVGQVRGTENTNSLQKLYSSGKYKQVTDSFKNIDQPLLQDYFIAANAYLQQRKPAEAITYFKKVSSTNQQNNSGLLTDDTEYYLAMSYLQNNQPALALPLLEKIYTQKNHLYNDKVSGFLLLKARLLAKK